SNSAGAAIDDVIIYVGIEGKPIPKIIEAIIVKNNVNSKLPAPNTKIAFVIFKPNPVKEATPTIIPTIPHAIATLNADLVPFSSAFSIPLRPILVVGLRKAITTVEIIAKKAAKIGVFPLNNK